MSEIKTEKQVRRIFESFLEGSGGYELALEQAADENGKKFPFFLLKHPWQDQTLALSVPLTTSKAKALAAVLSRVDLPENYSAILHKDTRQLEVFWTAYKIREKHRELSSRKFSIWWRGEKRECRFGPASKDAMSLAKSTLPIAAPSHTEHRNILSFYHFAHDSDHHSLGEPTCFWVDCRGIDDCDLDGYLRTVNFYMTYYDRETPRVLIHEPRPKSSGSERPRYAEGTFPEELIAGDIDPSVTSFWLGAFETRDPAMKYLLHYRLIEFLAMSYVKSEQHKDLIGILRRPHLISSTEGAAAEIAGLFALQARETDRLKKFVEETVNSDKVWAVIEMNKQDFCSTAKFDGGYQVKAIISQEHTKETFSKVGPIGLVDKLRAIRNCLAHGQDEGTRGVIHTTQRNARVLGPWVNLIETFAAEAMLYARRTYVPGET